jgi:hypothetical protein
VTDAQAILRWIKALWLATWPFCALAIFAGLALVTLLPSGYGRAIVAAPIAFAVPGSLTLSALFSQRFRPQGIVFVCYTVLLSAAWSVFASLVLYALGDLITAGNTYWCLLIVSAVLATAAEARLLLERPGKGRRVADAPEDVDLDLSDSEINNAELPTKAGRRGYYAFLATIAGVSLLVGGTYSYEHLPHPAPVGYTWIAWTGPQIKGNVDVGATGTKLGFQIVHHQEDTATFQLSASWQGTHLRPLARPLTLRIGPDQTFRGTLFVPPLPDGCIYRIEVALIADKQIDPFTKKQQTWFINADIHDPSKSLRTCK